MLSQVIRRFYITKTQWVKKVIKFSRKQNLYEAIVDTAYYLVKGAELVETIDPEDIRDAHLKLIVMQCQAFSVQIKPAAHSMWICAENQKEEFYDGQILHR